nr:sporulation initiation factor Spo0A C-terminal domain-containing protein [uncultured Ruminococcus sp.]
MEMKKTFIVVEDEEYICDQYRLQVEDHENLYLIGTTNNAPDAVDMVKEYTPDAVVLDIELNQGNGDGFTFLDDIKETCVGKKPLIIVVTNLISSLIHSRIHEKGGDYIITKSKPDYSVEMVLNTIDSLVSVDSLDKSRQAELAKIMAKQEYSMRLKKKIAVEMEKLGMKPSLKGARYLKDAIEMNVEKRRDNTKAELSEKYSVTADSIEKAMRHAIEVTWNNDPAILLFHYTSPIDPKRGSPSPSEFVFHYVDKIKREL